MQQANQHAAAVERAVVDAVECAVLAPSVGRHFDGVVVDKNAHGVIVQLREPAVIAPMAALRRIGRHRRRHARQRRSGRAEGRVRTEPAEPAVAAERVTGPLR